MSENFAPPAGWYTDPQNPAQTRYWDGAAWTHHVASPTWVPSAAAAVLPAAPVTYAGQPKKRGLGTGAIIAIVAGGGMVVIIAILAAIAIPVFTTQRAKAIDVEAKGDAASLGLEIATYFVDHDGAAPQIVVVDGYYVFEDGTPMTRNLAVSPYVHLGGQHSDSWDDWCVWVTGPRGDLKDFEYSARNGLKQGRCGE